jgi:2-dehydro-3-deoxyphosphogluconate aldolase/(4S)-4-hydroxy-2-oxoglutarate aldolase
MFFSGGSLGGGQTMNATHFVTDEWPFHSRVVPVIVITHESQAIPLALALLKGGIDVMEVTLRHPAGLGGIAAVAREVPAMHVGAGTVTRAAEVTRVLQAGARFAFSPGLTSALHEAARDQALPLMPGVMTPSEVMRARDWGYRTVKLFPAAQAGGLSMVQALAGPLPDVSLCPTGGISAQNAAEFLRQPNVAMVGGSWVTPQALIEAGDWSAITQLARQANDMATQVRPEVA